MKKMFMAMDQYDQTYHIGQNPPRKYLLDYLGKTSAEKMYRDKKDGSVVHVGYIIGDLWLELFEVVPYEKEVTNVT